MYEMDQVRERLEKVKTELWRGEERKKNKPTKRKAYAPRKRNYRRKLQHTVEQAFKNLQEQKGQ